MITRPQPGCVKTLHLILSREPPSAIQRVNWAFQLGFFQCIFGHLLDKPLYMIQYMIQSMHQAFSCDRGQSTDQSCIAQRSFSSRMHTPFKPRVPLFALFTRFTPHFYDHNIPRSHGSGHAEHCTNVDVIGCFNMFQTVFMFCVLLSCILQISSLALLASAALSLREDAHNIQLTCQLMTCLTTTGITGESLRGTLTRISTIPAGYVLSATFAGFHCLGPRGSVLVLSTTARHDGPIFTEIR